MKPNRVFIIVSLVIAFFLLLNANAFFFNGVNVLVDGKNWTYVCSNDQWLFIWGNVIKTNLNKNNLFLIPFNININIIKVHLVTYSLAPFAFLITINSLMLFHVYRSSKRLKSQTPIISLARKSSVISSSPKQSLNKTIIISTIMFIVMTLPTAISSIYFTEWVQTDEGNLLINLFDDLSFTYHGFNFFILTSFNRKFREMLFINFRFSQFSHAQISRTF